jgi:hypothetical protein
MITNLIPYLLSETFTKAESTIKAANDNPNVLRASLQESITELASNINANIVIATDYSQEISNIHNDLKPIFQVLDEMISLAITSESCINSKSRNTRNKFQTELDSINKALVFYKDNFITPLAQALGTVFDDVGGFIKPLIDSITEDTISKYNKIGQTALQKYKSKINDFFNPFNYKISSSANGH